MKDCGMDASAQSAIAARIGDALADPGPIGKPPTNNLEALNF